MTTIAKELADYDWEHIFSEYVSGATHVRTKARRETAYTREDVARVVKLAEGENDGADWVGLFHMADGKWLTVRAGCDYTGWGCQEGGSAEFADTRRDAVAFGLTQEERTRLGVAARSLTEKSKP